MEEKNYKSGINLLLLKVEAGSESYRLRSFEHVIDYSRGLGI